MKVNLDSSGIKITCEEFIIRFGNKNYLSVEADSKLYSSRQCFIKQVHGIQCVEADPDNLKEADAQWTNEGNMICIIKTADCMPLFIVSSNEHKLLAIHAGWKGLVAGVIENSVLKMDFQDLKHLKVFIGPHIGKNSFEVQKNVFEQIEVWFHNFANSKYKNKKWYYQSNDRFLINLEKLTQLLLLSIGFSEENIHSFCIDTKVSHDWNSYRRSSGDPNRNISWGQMNTIAK